MNKVILKGRTTKLPEVRHSENDENSAYARFTLAVTDWSWKLDDDRYHVDFIPCYGTGKVATKVEKNVGKGQEILVYGKWRTSSYEKDGQTIYTQNLQVLEIEYCGKKADSPPPYDDTFMDIPDYPDGELPFN